MRNRQAKRLGITCIVLAVAFRLLSAGFFHPFFTLLHQFGAPFPLSWETGQALHPTPQIPTAAPTSPQETHPVPPPTQPQVLTFDPEELSGISITYHAALSPSLENLLTQPLSWELSAKEPTVLIIHTHTTETYTGSHIPYDGDYRTLDERYNMVCVGKELQQALRQRGICALHDTTIYDYPDYDSAYAAARNSIEEYLRRYPSIQMVLDLHRDASNTPTGQLTTSAIAGGQKTAQLMMVVGTDAGGLYHPNWQENLALALKLTALLERSDPGISRPIDLRTQRFNMDLTPGSLLVEVGAAGDTPEEARIAVHALAQAIAELSQGSS